MEFALKDVIDLGTQGVFLFLLWQVWQRLNFVTDYLIRREDESIKTSSQIAELISDIKDKKS